MRLNRNLGMILLAIYLILVGLQALFSFAFSGFELVTGICALAAGILFLINR